MAEERFEPREINFRQWFPFTQIFRGFALALDHRKALLAAAGILVMAFGWWLLAIIFFAVRNEPDWGRHKQQYRDFREFQAAREQWNLFYEGAGSGPAYTDENDLAQSEEDWNALFDSPEFTKLRSAKVPGSVVVGGKTYDIQPKPFGMLRTWPWFEHRGPNPFLLLVGRQGYLDERGVYHRAPWTRIGFAYWLLNEQVPVLIEPLVKFFRPVFYLLSGRASILDRFYYVLVLLWTLGTWAIFGGAITRIAAVELARNEKVDTKAALRYAGARWRSYLFASFAPLLGVAFFLLVLMFMFGIPNLIPFVAEFWDGILWPLVIGLGLVIAFLLIGLAGWPMIHTTLSAEGSDSYDALSRCYSYVLQYPWSYAWYVLNAILYGAVVVFFVVLMGSMAVHLGKLGMHLPLITQYFNRDPSYMFVWAPTTFGWHDLLTQGSQYPVWGDTTSFRWFNYIGAAFVTFWLYLLLLLIVGFSYVYFWSASTIIYFLMRRKVDEAEFDEVYLEEDESMDSYPAPFTPATPATAAPSGAVPLNMVEAPTLKPTPPAASVPTAPATPAVPLAPPTPPSVSPTPPVPVAVETPAKPASDGNAANDPGLR